MRKAITIILVALFCTYAFAQDESEANVSSNFIIDLINKVEWPSNGSDSFVINVVGRNDLVPILKSLAESNSKMKIVINSKSIDENFEQCQLLFIATDSLSHLAKILKKVENKPTLTVSNHGTFARYGVMVNIREIKNNTVKYAVNNMTARRSKLKISDDLIKKAVETFG